MYKTEIYISLPDGHHGYGVEIFSENKEFITKALVTANALFFSENIKNRLGTFLQGKNENWLYYEFLNFSPEKSDDLLSLAMILASVLGLSLDIK
jgi:hypothetical protein